MPILSVFYGIVVKVYFEDHNPPHLHVEYAEMSAVIEIKTGRILYGKLPKRILPLFDEWRRLHLFELLQAWSASQAGKIPKKIRPLV